MDFNTKSLGAHKPSFHETVFDIWKHQAVKFMEFPQAYLYSLLAKPSFISPLNTRALARVMYLFQMEAPPL